MHLIVRNYFQTNNQPIRHEMGYTIAEAASIRRVFYSSMYRASIFPRQLTEYDADGNAFHWSPYAANSTVRVMEGPLSTDSGFWDAWNTVYPLLTLNNRPVLGEMINGWLNEVSSSLNYCLRIMHYLVV
mmetsp:Transcript_34020/g.46704  ORF Transcript_34020/g.46704 Transcript_34020/m.46704 type:complete len:129 (+) Transcript_34020:526-912(+)